MALGPYRDDRARDTTSRSYSAPETCVHSTASSTATAALQARASRVTAARLGILRPMQVLGLVLIVAAVAVWTLAAVALFHLLGG